jgi:hypothetical protein
MVYTGGLAVSLTTATTGVIDKLEAWEELTAEEARFLAAYQTALASADTNSQDDLRFKFIFDRWFMRNVGK